MHRRNEASHHLRYNGGVPMQGTKWSVRWKYLSGKNLITGNTKNSITEKQARKTTTISRKALSISCMYQQHMCTCQSIRKQKCQKNDCHRKVNIILEIPKKTISEALSKLSKLFERPLSLKLVVRRQSTLKKYQRKRFSLKNSNFFWNHEKSNLRKTNEKHNH